MSKSTQITESGPILGHLPRPPDVRTGLLLVEKLQGHTSSPAWLPEGIWPELDELRDEQLARRRQIVTLLEARGALLAGFSAEDKEHTRALEQAARDGSTPPGDGRTAADQRDREVAALDGRLWASIRILAELVDSTIEFIREREGELLADLRSWLGPAQEKRRQAAALLEEAKAEEFRLYRLGSWVQLTADDQSFGRQPAPTVVAPPAQVSADVVKDSLERPWHRRREWSRVAA